MTKKFDEVFETLIDSYDFESVPTYVDWDGNEIEFGPDDEEEDIEGEEETVVERITKRMVIRGGEKVWKYKTNKPGYRVAIVNGKPKEVRMKAAEKRKRKIASRKTQRKVKSKRRTAQRKRKRSERKRSRLGARVKERPA